MTDAEVLDRLSVPSFDGSWSSPCDFIEFAAGLIRMTGRDVDPPVLD